MSTSKRDRVTSWIRRAVRRELMEIMALENDDKIRAWLRQHLDRIPADIAAETQDDYRWLELCDIMDWRKRKPPQ